MDNDRLQYLLATEITAVEHGITQRTRNRGAVNALQITELRSPEIKAASIQDDATSLVVYPPEPTSMAGALAIRNEVAME